MKDKTIVALLLTIIHLSAGALFIYSLEYFYVGVTFVIGGLWVIFTGMTLDIAANEPFKMDRWK